MREDEEERPETVTKYRRVIVSYDVSSRRRYAGLRVTQYVFGRKVSVRTKEGLKTYRYEGLIMRPAVDRLGQSVLIMREKDAEDFHTFLTELRVSHTRQLVWTEF